MGRPDLWVVALSVTRRLAPRGWWHRPPFLPLPDPRWLAFRMETAYGSPSARPSPRDLLEYLEWVREYDRSAG